jgi:flagellar hook-associated protein 2
MTQGINLAAFGLGGLDTTTLVQSLVAIEQQPLNALSARQQNIQGASAMINSFSSTLSSLKNAAVALSTPASFQSLTASSSDPSVVASTSTTNGTPAAGQWTVDVLSVAQAQRTLSQATTDPTADLGMGGSFQISDGSGHSATINLAGQSLNDIAGEISSAAATSGLRLQASVVPTTSSSGQTQYQLLVSGLDTGAANKISFDESKATFGSYSLGWDATNDPKYDSTLTIQSAQNASVQIDGTPASGSTPASGYNIQSASNQITNAIPGVTLAVTQKSTTPATVTIAPNASGLDQSIQNFVTAYNTVVNNGHSAAGYASQTAANSLLQGDVAIRSSLGQLEQLFAHDIPGTTGAYTTLASVGIMLNDDGTLSFDQGTFASALQADPRSVERLFVTDSSNGSTGIMGTIGSAVDSLTDPINGAITAEVQSFPNQSTEIGTEMTDMQQRITTYQTRLQAEFTQMNTTMVKYKQVMNAINPSSNSSNSSNNVL